MSEREAYTFAVWGVGFHTESFCSNRLPDFIRFEMLTLNTVSDIEYSE